MSDTSTTYPLCTKDPAGKAYVYAASADYGFMLLREKDETVMTITTNRKVIDSFKKLYGVYAVSDLKTFASVFFEAAETMNAFLNVINQRTTCK